MTTKVLNSGINPDSIVKTQQIGITDPIRTITNDSPPLSGTAVSTQFSISDDFRRRWANWLISDHSVADYSYLSYQDAYALTYNKSTPKPTEIQLRDFENVTNSVTVKNNSVNVNPVRTNQTATPTQNSGVLQTLTDITSKVSNIVNTVGRLPEIISNSSRNLETTATNVKVMKIAALVAVGILGYVFILKGRK